MILLNPFVWYLFILFGVASFIFMGVYYMIYATIIVILFSLSCVLLDFVVIKFKRFKNPNLTDKNIEKSRIITSFLCLLVFISYFTIQYKEKRAIEIKNEKEIEIKVNIEKEKYRKTLKELKERKEIKLDPGVIEELNGDWNTIPEQKNK